MAIILPQMALLSTSISFNILPLSTNYFSSTSAAGPGPVSSKVGWVLLSSQSSASCAVNLKLPPLSYSDKQELPADLLLCGCYAMSSLESEYDD